MPNARKLNKEEEFIVSQLQGMVREKKTPPYYRMLALIILANIKGMTNIPIALMPRHSKINYTPEELEETLPNLSVPVEDSERMKALEKFFNVGGENVPISNS